MLIERSMSDGFLTNTYLVADGPGGAGFLVDAGGPMQPLFDAAEQHDIDVTHLLLTHHHHDHVLARDEVVGRYPQIVVLGHPEEPMQAEPFEPLEIGGLPVDAVHTPGHTKGMLNFTVPGHVFTGDTLFKRSIGGEWEHNAFIRVWRGLDAEGDERVTVQGRPATLIVWGDDYDGGHKAWVRWEDGRDDIVPGSQVARTTG